MLFGLTDWQRPEVGSGSVQNSLTDLGLLLLIIGLNGSGCFLNRAFGDINDRPVILFAQSPGQRQFFHNGWKEIKDKICIITDCRLTLYKKSKGVIKCEIEKKWEHVGGGVHSFHSV